MKKKFWIIGGLVLGAVVIVALLFLLPSGGQGRPAMVIETINQVDAHPRPKDDWQPAAVGMDIYGGGQVRTGTESAARLELLEGVVRLSAESIFTVKESATRQGRLVTALFLESGRLWAHVTTDQPHEFTVETGSAVVAVRDTRFSVRVADGETLLSVAEGQAVLTAQEQSVTVVAGQQAMVKPGQPPTPPEPMSDDERRLWASEGEMLELAPPAPTITPVPPTPSVVPPTATTTPLAPGIIPTPLPTEIHTAAFTPTATTTPDDTPTPTNTPSPTLPPTSEPTPTPLDTPVKVGVWGDVICHLTGSAGDPASRNPETVFNADVPSDNAAQVMVESPSGDIVMLPRYGDVFGGERRFYVHVQGLPEAGGIYTFTALDADGTPIPGAVTSDVYLGGYEPDPPTNIQAEVIETGILVTWNPSPVIPGGFDPTGSPPLGHYLIHLEREGVGVLYGWDHWGRSLPKMSHLIPFRRHDFGPGDRGLALEELDDGVYYLSVHAHSVAPEGTAGRGKECTATDPAENIRFVIEGGQVRVEEP